MGQEREAMSSWQQFFMDHFILEDKRVMEFLSWLIMAGDLTGLNLYKLTYEQLEALYEEKPWQMLLLRQCEEEA